MTTVEDEVLGARKVTQDRESKIELLRRLFPQVDTTQYAERIASVDVRSDGSRVIIHFHDDDRLDVEPKKQRVRQFGIGDHAKALAMALADSTLTRFFQHPDDDWGRGKSPASAVKLAVMSRQHADIIADRWRERGYSEVTVSPRGVLVEVDEGAWLRDRDTEAHLHGKTTDAAIKALMLKAAMDWNGRIELIGTEEYKARAWAIAQEVGVTVVGYEPPEVQLDGGRNPTEQPRPEAKGEEPVTSAPPEPKTVEKIQPSAEPLKPDNAAEIAHPVPKKPLKASTTIISPPGSTIVRTEASKAASFEALLKASNDDDYDVAPFNDDGPSI